MKTLKMSIMVLFHPVVTFQYIQKNRSEFSYLPVAALLLLSIIVRIFSIQVTHYPLAAGEPRNTNIMLECIKLFVPVLTWVLASYAMTTILDGETLFREALLAMAYSLVPYIVFTVPLTLLSRIMELSQGSLYYSIQNAILFIINMKEMNHFSGKKTLVIILLSLFTMAMIWATVALFFAISSQFISFVQEVLLEMKYKVD